jgi:hypothetical protein
MKLRSPAAPLLLPVITFGIYSLVWLVKTKNEMNRAVSAKTPTAWLLIVPIANLVWYWRYGKSVASFTNGIMGAGATFWLFILLGPIGHAIVQSSFNATIRGQTFVPVAPTGLAAA